VCQIELNGLGDDYLHVFSNESAPSAAWSLKVGANYPFFIP
jgi:hypothetical protein